MNDEDIVMKLGADVERTERASIVAYLRGESDRRCLDCRPIDDRLQRFPHRR